jgi:YidC/Oxa1 family membrane protein insertase
MITANVLQPLIDVFEGVLKFFHDSIGASWGLSIILLTIVVRAALLPLAVKQFNSMQALQRIAPQLKQLQEKYRDDKQRLQQETMKFYQEHKVNPFASCLPLVAQLPVFLSLFYMLRKDLRIDICGQSAEPCGATPASEFWFIPDITDKATGGVLITLIVLYVGSQLISSLLMMTATADKNQRMIMLVLPFVFVPFILGFPAGLILYWITTNFWTIGQQQFLRRVVGKGQPQMSLASAAGLKDDAGGVASPKKSDGKREREAPAAKGGKAEKADKPGKADKADKAAASAANGASAAEDGKRRTKAPPPPPRQKRKRSGRRR